MRERGEKKKERKKRKKKNPAMLVGYYTRAHRYLDDHWRVTSALPPSPSPSRLARPAEEEGAEEELDEELADRLEAVVGDPVQVFRC